MREMLEQSSLALVAEMPAIFAAAAAEETRDFALELTLSPKPDALDEAMQ